MNKSVNWSESQKEPTTNCLKSRLIRYGWMRPMPSHMYFSYFVYIGKWRRQHGWGNTSNWLLVGMSLCIDFWNQKFSMKRRNFSCMYYDVKVQVWSHKDMRVCKANGIARLTNFHLNGKNGWKNSNHLSLFANLLVIILEKCRKT